MPLNRDVLVFYDEQMLGHSPDVSAAFLAGRLDNRIREILSGLKTQWKYPEHPGRLEAVIEILNKEPIEGVRFASGKAATREQLNRVHTSRYLDTIYSLDGKSAWLDIDTTAVSPGSVRAAEVAAGTSIAAVEAVINGECKTSFALVRPPGHHAESSRARGFCLLNNVAIAASHAQAALGQKRILILDWDVHHGNGTHDLFFADPDVMFFDIHRQAPFYPGTGQLEQIGVGLGEGTTVNVPLPGGSGDMAYLKVFHEILTPAVEFFKPNMILVSTGFDPHWYDLAMNVSYEGFAEMTRITQDLADKYCDGKLSFILEGGYNIESLSKGVHAVLKVLSGQEVPKPTTPGLEEVEAAIAFHREAFLQSNS